MPYDLLIKNARIIDGSGGPSSHGNVAVTGGRIAGLGRADGQAQRVIDAHGLAVSPGFIDMHTHYDAQLAWDPLCTPSCYHGTTSVVMGNCGYALSPVRPADRDYVMGMFSSVEGVSKHTLISGLPWAWETQADYFAWLRQRGLGINVAPQVGHSAVRRYVLGAQAHERLATADEVAAMKSLVRQGMEAGAIGFSTSRVAHQKGEHGEPIPSFMAAEDEMFTLAGVLREMGRGIIGINPRTKAKDFNQEDRDQLFRLAKATGRVVNWNEFNQRWEYPDQWLSLLDYMEDAQRQGAQVYAVMRCQRMDLHFNLRHLHAAFSSPIWRAFVSLSDEEKLRRLADPASRAGMPLPRLEHIGVAVAALPKNRALDGRLLVDAARERGLDPTALFLDLAREEALDTEFAFFGVTNGDEAAVERMLRSPATITGISDAGAHLHSMCGVDYPTYFLSRWVREKGAFSLEQGVAGLTSAPAKVAGLRDRGVLCLGAAADLCIFDPGAIAPEPLEVWKDLPGGETRHVKRARGIEWVIVNGEPVVQKGAPTGALPGKLLSN